jgi:hypothetical protein
MKYSNAEITFLRQFILFVFRVIRIISKSSRKQKLLILVLFQEHVSITEVEQQHHNKKL